MKKWVLGITGGIGSGKTAVATLFMAHGIGVVDADQVARWVVTTGQPVLAKIADYFSESILLEDGSLNRTLLREIIFQDVEKRHWLEQLLHPLIRDKIYQLLENTDSAYSILVSPLLLESGQHRMVDRILVIDIPEPMQIARTMLRDKISEQQVKNIMRAQLPAKERLSHADDVITNDKDHDYLTQQVDQLHQLYLTISREKNG